MEYLKEQILTEYAFNAKLKATYFKHAHIF